MEDKKMKNRPRFLDLPLFRILLTAASTIISVVVLVFSSLIIYNVAQNNYDVAPTLLLWTFVFLGLMSVVLFLKKWTKVHLVKCITILIINVTLGVITLFAKENPFLFSLTAGLYCVTIVLSRIFELINDHSIRSIILNALIIVFAVILALGIFTSPTEKPEDLQGIILVECIFIAIVSFIEAMLIALAQLKFKVLFRIIVSTYSLEVLFGLLIMIVVFSFAFMTMEPDIASYPDALWYCFAVVTTIGFGDFAAVTPVGRILTVILGFYGIVVVAVITSIVVNFYNETQGKRDQKEIKEISKSEKKDR